MLLSAVKYIDNKKDVKMIVFVLAESVATAGKSAMFNTGNL